MPDAEPGRGRPAWLRPLLVGMATVAAGVGALSLLPDHGPPSPSVSFSTQVGEIRSAKLADGSLALLNSDSAISVEYKPNARRITLERGEAIFTVAPDVKRPFIVRVDSGVAIAVGTRFDLLARRYDAELVVLEGRVLARRYDAQSSEIVVSQGQAVVLGGDAPLQVRTADLARIEAWQHVR